MDIFEGEIMKKVLASILAVTLLVSLVAGCGGKGKIKEKTDVYVFAAASMQATLEQISADYKKVEPNINLIFNFDSSGTLKTQIENGAECDIFISAAQKQMNALDALNMVDKSTRLNLLENKVALVVPEGNPRNITSYNDLDTDKLELLALGNDDVPVGAYAHEILGNMGIYDKLNAANKITFATNVTEVAKQVKEGTVSAGVVYATDASTHGLKVVAEPPAGTLATPVIYPAAVMSATKHAEAAKNFLDYLQGDAAMKVFESVGFANATALK